MDPLHNPHDKLFKAGFSDPDTAAAFLQEHLPPPIVGLIDWPRLSLQPGSFISPQMRERHSDLLFSAPLCRTPAAPSGQPPLAYFYILFEHLTTPDRWIALRLLEYMTLIWQGFLKNSPEATALPVILPIVLAQNESTWQLRTQFAELLQVPPEHRDDLAAYLPQFCFRLVQLAEMPFEAIRGTPAGILVLRTMKAERLQRLLDDRVWDEALLVQVPRVVFQQVLRYILGAADIDREAFEHKLQQIAEPQTRAEAMTLAQQYHHQGRQEGRQEDVLEALETRFEQVPEGLVEAVRSIQDEAHLRHLLRTAIRC
ncbi:MAG: Rpn family recombination-promoting nuclease/putative transposase, partial [Prosthecobacter sp.]|nr:Rpn family recombination-promoting nuclease/putative transposase [Prosthecobacter sp.]